jgi:diguanylate cyclase (GGDEF)-like protein
LTPPPAVTDDRLLAAIRQVLEGLKKTPDGEVLYSFIERGLRKFGMGRIETAFLAFVDKLLVRYLDGPYSDPATRVRIKVIQQRLRPYLSDIPARLAPATPVPTTTPVVEKPAPAVHAPVEVVREPTVAPAVAEPAHADVGSESLPNQLAQRMADALTRGRDFDSLLRTSLQILDESDEAPDAELKELLRTGIEELIAEHRTLGNNLAETRRGLQVMADDRRQMEKALNQARKNSLTDELTGLPNRNAFLRQLTAEIGRARRYGFSLALALIDLDDLNAINERHGYAAGDTILHTYAREILSLFRGYDMVARYADDEFAVLLPNTQKDGAVRALDKAQKHASGTSIQFNGQNLPLPSFSSVLTLYSHGEQPEALLKRADEALSHAKQRGRAQSVVALAAN